MEEGPGRSGVRVNDQALPDAIELRIPLLFNLRRDPFERAQHNSNTYNDWFLDRPFVIVPITGMAANFLKTMIDYPPSGTAGSFNLSKMQKQIEELSKAH